MVKPTVLFDGWPLVWAPETPAAQHLRAVLAVLDPQAVDAAVALPGTAPEWLPDTVRVRAFPYKESPKARLRWEQRTLPLAAREAGADLVHLTQTTPAFWGGLPTLVSPTGWVDAPERGFLTRVRNALARGGMARVQGVAWPADLPMPPSPAHFVTLPPVVHPDYGLQPSAPVPEIPGMDLPETFVLYHNTGDPAALSLALRAWTWAAGPVGQVTPLLMVGLTAAEKDLAQELIARHDLGETVLIAPALAPLVLPGLYQHAALVFHPAPEPPWGGPVRRALACGRPVVAVQTSLTGALVGPAAFLQPAEAVREIGAALITLLVQENVAENLAQAARARAAHWDTDAFGTALVRVYQEMTAR